MAKAFEQQYRIESQLRAVHHVEREILRILKEMGYSEDDLFNVRLALDEACSNAIKHGNRENPGKTISVGVRVDLEAVRMEVKDEGDGFDYTSILDPRDLDRLHETGGRGLFLIQQFMEQVDFNQEGNSICMVYQKGKDLGRPRSIRKRIFNGIAIIEVLRPVGREMSRAWLDEVERTVSEGYPRIILDLRRGSAPCAQFCGAIIEAAESLISAEGGLVVICTSDPARACLQSATGKRSPQIEECLSDAVRMLCRGEVST